MPAQTTDPAIFKLTNVRLSFPHLFTAHAMEEGQEPKFSATFILDCEQNKAEIEMLEKLIPRLALDFWKKKIGYKSCLRDGNDKPDMDGYGDGKMFIAAARKQRPAVVDRALNPLAEDDGVIYAGCYVNMTGRLWVQDNKFGKRVNAELRAVQFVKDGESFGAGPVNAEDEFDAIDEQVGDKGRSKQKGSPSVDDF